MCRAMTLTTAFLLCSLVQAIAAPAIKGPVRGEPTGIVGKWELTKSTDEGAPVGAIVEFTKDGKVVIRIDINGMKIELAGTYKLDGDQLTVSITPPAGCKDETDTDTIKSLSEEKLVLIDKQKKENEFTRKK
jgi:uncharacterized protein (TIGR03066 family)